MWIFDKLFKKQPPKSVIAPTLDGFIPIYPQMGITAYECDVVQQSLKCIVDEVKKVEPRHVRYIKSDPVPLKSTLQDVLDNPNPLMTTSEFFEKVTWMLLLNYNAFIIPIFETWQDEKTGAKRRDYKALYPIKPQSVDFIEDASGKLYTKFWFFNGENTTLPYDDIIHLRYNFSVNTFMGGDIVGQPDLKAINSTVKLNETLLNGVAKALNASYAINGLVKYNTMFDNTGMENAVAEFNRKLMSSESGFVPIDMKSEIVPFERKTQLIDEPTLKFIDEKLLRNYGISLPILTGNYTKEQYEAFFQRGVTPILTAMQQAFTKKIFTPRERAFGHRIELYPKELVFLTMEQKIKVIEQFSPTGTIFENEKRTLIGLPPLPELEGKRYMSLNWIDANDASQYQIGKENIEVVDEEKEVI